MLHRIPLCAYILRTFNQRFLIGHNVQLKWIVSTLLSISFLYFCAANKISLKVTIAGIKYFFQGFLVTFLISDIILRGIFRLPIQNLFN